MFMHTTSPGTFATKSHTGLDTFVRMDLVRGNGKPRKRHMKQRGTGSGERKAEKGEAGCGVGNERRQRWSSRFGQASLEEPGPLVLHFTDKHTWVSLVKIHAALRQEVEFIKKGEGDILSRLSVDSSIIGESMTGNLSELDTLMMSSVGHEYGLITFQAIVRGMLYLLPWLTPLMLGIIPPVSIGAAISSAKEAMGDMTKVVAQESLAALRTVQAFDTNTHERVTHILSLVRQEAVTIGLFYRGTSWSVVIPLGGQAPGSTVATSSTYKSGTPHHDHDSHGSVLNSQQQQIPTPMASAATATAAPM
ncbi:hypothetical protein SCLCIDRAFT_10932 [Scleroderma citrinum Foug A]|uniref:ABC transmembrane type-1 domain-containing protein n=1 Tax=Scleroderma citrinum Foug A TaxID=1036808 RepID=A0A0C3DH61_9AGAM|nr:hypothetical protein SCLCIDRAFT_10932 [Scleroderma citrinum Foug A]